MRTAYIYLTMGLILLFTSIIYMIIKGSITGAVVGASSTAISATTLSLGLVSLLIARGELKKQIKEFGEESVISLIKKEAQTKILEEKLREEKTDVIVNAVIKIMIDGVIEKNFKKMEVICSLRGLLEKRILMETETVTLNKIFQTFGRTITLLKSINYVPKRSISTLQSLYMISKNCLSKKLVS